MENQVPPSTNQPINPVSPVSGPVVNVNPNVPAPESSNMTEENKLSVKEKMKVLIDNVVLVFRSLNPKIKKLLLVLIVLIILLLVAILVKGILSGDNKSTKEKASPTPSISIESPNPDIILNPSRYATDSGVLAIDENLKRIEGELNDAQINDSKLSVPNLLWDVNFEE